MPTQPLRTATWENSVSDSAIFTRQLLSISNRTILKYLNLNTAKSREDLFLRLCVAPAAGDMSDWPGPAGQGLDPGRHTWFSLYNHGNTWWEMYHFAWIIARWCHFLRFTFHKQPAFYVPPKNGHHILQEYGQKKQRASHEKRWQQKPEKATRFFHKVVAPSMSNLKKISNFMYV